MLVLRSSRICPVCLLTEKLRVARIASLPWTSRLFHTKVRGDAVRLRSPSRMVLSKDVARSRPSRTTRAGRVDRTQRNSTNPFSGMNQTRFRPPDSPKSTPTRMLKGGRDGGKGLRRTKAMKMQTALTSVGYGHRTRVKSSIINIDSFDKFNLLPEIRQAINEDTLKGMTNLRPTAVQRLAIPALLGQRLGWKPTRGLSKPDELQEFLIAAETGSGKTLAYLAPIVDAIKRAELADPTIAQYREYFEKQSVIVSRPGYRGRLLEPHPTTARPKAIILVPSAELVEQINAIAKSLSHTVKFKSIALSANLTPTVIQKRIYSPRGIDIIIATPHLLESIAKSDPNILSRVTHLVADEADSLFDRSFIPITMSILDRATPSLKQLVLCSATIPKQLDTLLNDQFPNIRRITTPNLHAVPRRVQLGVINVTKDPYRDNKDLACADAIWSIGKDAERFGAAIEGEANVKQILVFVNERERTQPLVDYLISKGIDAVALNRDMAEQRKKSEMLKSFTSREPLRVPVSDGPTKINGVRVLPSTKVLVATDLASRGIDTLAVQHVILYDVPHTTIDFIHRLGRAGRMGKRGKGIVLVGRYDRSDVVAEVRESMFMGKALI